MPRSKHFLDMLVVSFQLAPSLIVLITCKLTHYQNFHCSYYDFMQGHSLSSLTIQVALMLHGLVSTQALLIFLVHIQWSCCSLPRLLQLLTSHVTLRGEGGHMHETNWIFEQTPPSHFYLKVVCKRGEYIKAKITTLKNSVQFNPLSLVPTCQDKELRNANICHTANCLHSLRKFIVPSTFT